MKFLIVGTLLAAFIWVAVSAFQAFPLQNPDPQAMEDCISVASREFLPSTVRVTYMPVRGLRWELAIIQGKSKIDGVYRSSFCSYDTWTGRLRLSGYILSDASLGGYGPEHARNSQQERGPTAP